MSWMTPWPGPVRRVRLAREDDLHRAFLVPQEAREPVEVGEQQRRPLVGREPAGEADREDRRVEDGLELLERRGRLAVAGELVAQAAAGEDRELELLALVGLPQLVRRDLGDALPEPPRRGLVVHRLEVGVRVPLEDVAHRLADPGRRVDAVREPEDLVRADALPGRVRGMAVEQRDRVRAVRHAQAQRGHVELRRVVLHAEAEAEQPLDRHAAGRRAAVAVEQRPGDAAHEVGVEALVAGRDRRVDREHAVAADGVENASSSGWPAATSSRERSASRNAE